MNNAGAMSDSSLQGRGYVEVLSWVGEHLFGSQLASHLVTLADRNRIAEKEAALLAV